jgi:ribosomal protein L37AE/L43A
MFIAFGNKKCPVCGNLGTEMTKEVFHCESCRITFNEFSMSSYSKIREEENKFWN